MVQRVKLEYHKSLVDYFRERLQDGSRHYRPPPHQDTLWYLGDMLARFGSSDALFSYRDGSLTLRPLALLYGDAREAATPHQRSLILQQLGDMALFVGAVFPESYRRKGLRKDYLVGMGGAAYAYLSERESRHRHIFAELSETFTRALELVSHSCICHTALDASEVLALYRRWKRNGNPLLRRQLEAIGIDPEKGVKIH